jgi:S1-C subfamily serine protease/predicted esterase
MSRFIRIPALLTWLAFGTFAAAQPAGDAGLDSALETALKAAVHKVAPCVVQIQTAGGLDVISTGPAPGRGPMNPMAALGIGSGIRAGEGPTTGVIVSPDGYVLSSAYNFANKPTEIFVAVPGKRDRFVAKVIASDHSRMLTLLKIDASGLPVPQAAPKKEFKVGQWALALGRTWSSPDSPPSQSVGILSALDRIWGKAVQTDAKVSPVNYGGPLVDAQGRVIGILVPASPRAQDETAGHEWYDSGIGFAIPLEDVNAVLPRLKEGQDLHRGFLGFTPRGRDIYAAAAVIDAITPGSAAAKAGIKPGDTIVEINSAKVVRMAQVMHALGAKYEGDAVSVKIKRGDKELSFPDLKLTGPMTAVSHAFLGVLPLRDDPELGVEVRYVYPNSPAAAAGLKEGDRIMGLGQGSDKPQPFAGRGGLMNLLNNFAPGAEVKLDVRRADSKKTETLSAKLSGLPETVPDNLPEKSSLKKALEPPKTIGTVPQKEEPKKDPKRDPNKVETGFLKRSNASRDHEYWLYVPDNYNPNIGHALVVWLHAPGQGREKNAEAMAQAWEDYCNQEHVILLGPKAVNETGWLVSEGDFIREAVRDVTATYSIDRQRIIAHGMGVGGQLAFYLGLNGRDLFHGVATTGAVLASPPKQGQAGPRLSFFVVAGGKDPRARAIRQTKDRLAEHKFPVVFREIRDMGHQYLDEATLKELVRWIDSLDRI